MILRECTWCRFLKHLGSSDLIAELTEYIESLPDEIKVDEREHAKRLAICSECNGNNDGLCRYCGCYVAARTVKKSLSCPHPEGERWSKVTDKI